jgi:lipopolysaccharide biosynthesis regulator YciM
VAGDAELAEVAIEDSDPKGDAKSECEAKITAFEQRLRDDEGYEPEPEEELAIGRCYQTVGDTAKARKWLQRAAADPATKRRARKSMELLPAN